MTPDPGWLELLKASGWQTTAIAVGCGLFLLAGHNEVIPPLKPWMVQGAAFALLVSGCLAAASFVSNTLNALSVQERFSRWVSIRNSKNEFEGYIPHMTDQERKIISYLLAKNQKTFTCNVDGGFANTLMAQGIVVPTLTPGQRFAHDDMPVKIPEHLWNVLQQHKDEFPYEQPAQGDHEPHPWRRPLRI